MKDYTIYVDLHFVNSINAESKEDALNLVKENFINDYNLELEDREISFTDEFESDKLYNTIEKYRKFLETKGYDDNTDDIVNELVDYMNKQMEEI